jgi:hypothetical protein
VILNYALFTGTLIQFLGIAGTFGLMAAITIYGGITFVRDMKPTEGLTSAECKELYYPNDLKSEGLMIKLTQTRNQDGNYILSP